MSLDIVFCVAAYYPALEFGGPLPTVRALARGLQERGHGVEVWCADYGTGGHRVPIGQTIVDEVQVRYFRRWAAYRWAPVVPSVLGAARQSRADIVHVFGLRDGLSPLAMAGRRGAGRPYVVEPMGMLTPRIRSVALKNAYDRLLGTRLLDGAAGLIATSELEDGEIRTLQPTRHTWIRANPQEPLEPIGADPDVRQRLRMRDDELLLGYVGRISTKKGLDLLVDAVVATKGVKLVIAGPDSRDGGRDALAAAMAQPEAHEKVCVMGPVWGRDRDRLMSSFDAFVLPSRSENFGNAAAEAASLGVPVLTTRDCGIGGLVERYNCGVVTTATRDGIAAAITQFQEPGFRRAAAAGTALLRDALSPAAIAAEQEAIYVDALSR